MATLFDPIQLGDLALANRIVMSPMTRSRATAHGDLPTDLHVEYYGQRASAGLIISEGVHPSIHGKGYCRTPGIYNTEQIAAWRRVTSAVHERGGKIVLQIMHVGRIAAAKNKDPAAHTVAPSAIRANCKVFTDSVGLVDVDIPRQLGVDEIPAVVEEFRSAAVNACAAGFDGVELHCTSGYLPMQFLSASTNHRSDQYGGTPLRRIRFVVEVVESMCGAIGTGRVGVRICPGNPFNDIFDDDPVLTYSELAAALNSLRLAYVHVSRSPAEDIDAFALVRRKFMGPVVVNDGFDFETGSRAIDDGTGNAVSYARHFIANPDLVHRFRAGIPLSSFDRRTLYTAGAEGYTDYPRAVR